MELLVAPDGSDSAPNRSADRTIPRWAAPVLTKLIETAPSIVTEHSMAALLGSPDEERHAIRGLVRLGWLRGAGVQGAWAFLPPGVTDLQDPYLSLRGWRAVDAQAEFALAGTSAAWHLGYLRRRPETTSLWVRSKGALPAGLRGKLHIVTTQFPEATTTAPLGSLLRKRKLDLTAWAARLPAFGPEALVVQVAQRPASVDWTELAAVLDDVILDVDVERLKVLLGAASNAAKQRAAYFFVHANKATEAKELLPRHLQAVRLGATADGRGTWDKTTQVMDHLLASRNAAQDKA